ncbi:thiaminase (transcriptional activator TenA) [Streptoalloteichus tenebrarius]|uniref:Thiaminase (Transcriptional activator TenA) n=1 Tax=Streptoalloteichus tenebrarius (strain ATCC 17920 / DSM 40477 / JCM 4838 / CBS 697.72 / NBRC 16177 / NCIMB 11028 / NRRL B-12390 / A12253. 1 / ISP 5477) TaxID=1933 RepID=A0ABT1HRP4_STRSD|nr:hypothetical protein [Streptoalloteichus tenebrarius]MCP2258157.1 thiaminase (transcriptional activator TenA) [Streptoalloteichus tenebrarius]BFF04616.1 hypothetical protein GCM10020241_62910 [Streptoalloteichus tenebrarius]
MTFLDECRERTASVWSAYEHHPWIEALAAGGLTPEQFAFFQLDDGAHVAEFNRVLSLGIAKAPTGHPWAAAAARVLHQQSTDAELAEKRALVADLGFDVDLRSDRWTCSPAREGYVNHLVRVGFEGTFPEIAVSLYPCAMFTEVIGRRFRDVHVPGPEPFRRWAAIYTRRARSEMCAQHANVANEAATRLDEEGRARLLQLYRRSLEHQVRVFDAAWRLEGVWPGGRQAHAMRVRPDVPTPAVDAPKA